MNIKALLLLSVSMLLPVGCLAYSIELEYGWEVDQGLLGAEGGVRGNTRLSAVNDLKVLPDGYRVEGYEILWEDWREAGQDSGLTGTPDDDPGGVTFVGSGGFFGYTALKVVVQPTRVIDGRVSVLAGMGLRVDCSPGGLAGPAVKRRSPVADRLVRSLIEGRAGEHVNLYRTWQVEDHRDWVSTGPGLDGGVVDCVIISGDSLAGEFEPLAALHDRLGIRTVIRSMSWIRDRYPGSDGPERIRNFITDAYQNWGTIHVLLGGDIDVVPMRILNYPKMELILDTGVMPSDAYYTNLDGNWNADGDDIIGEYGPGTDDWIDIFPDIFVGRAPVSTVGEARLFVDKTMHYLRGSNPGIWHRTVLSLAQMIDKYSDGAVASENILEHFPEHFRQVRLYENYTEYPGALPETIANMIAYMDSGVGILSHIGHGDEFRLDLGNEFMERFHIQSAGNDTAYYFLYMMNCSSSDPLVECVAKAFLKDPDGGAFAVLGNSALAFPGTGLPMEEDFFEYVFSEDRPTIGAISAIYRVDYLTSDYLNSWWMYLNFILLGDPVVRLWTDEPVALDVIDSGTMQLGDSVYVVDVQDGGMPVDGAVVVLMGERGEYGVGVTGSDGLATVNYRPNGLGWVDLIINGVDYFVYEDSVDVQGAGGRCYVSSMSVDDGGGWVGNGDSEAGWGERVGLGVGLVNGGTGTLTGVGCDLSVVSGCSLYVSIAIDDSIRNDSLIYVGIEGVNPGSMPFGVGLSEVVLGRGLGEIGHELGCWLWLDGMGWHVRFSGDRDPHTYACSLSIYGDLLGYSGYGVESDDVVGLEGTMIVFEGSLDGRDFEDGVDLVVGDSAGVDVYVSHVDYGSVGGSEVVGWYDVGFGGGGVGDELGIWFEALVTDDGVGIWRDWFRLLVHDGDVVGERIEFSALGGDTLGVVYGLRNSGSGGLEGVEGRLRGVSGVEVTDSVSVYGELLSGAYVEGDGFKARELGGPVVYELYLFDGYGRSWLDTVEVRAVSGISMLRHLLLKETVELSWDMSGDSLLYGYDVYRSDDLVGGYSLIGMVDVYSRYVDEGLLHEESYYYYICARDSMGNTSVPSETLEVWTGPPRLTGWPAGLRGAAPSSPVSGDASHDGHKEIFVGSKGLEMVGFDRDGVTLAGYPYEGECEVWSSPVLVDLDNDGTLECVFGEGQANKGLHCMRIVALNHDGSFVSPGNNPGLPAGSPGWPQVVDHKIRSSPAAYDLDGDGYLEIIVGPEPNPAADTTTAVYAFRYDGSPYLETRVFAETKGGHWATPCIHDLDGSGRPEVIVCDQKGNLYIWEYDGTEYLADSTGLVYSTGSSFLASPVVGDIDDDDMPEIVAITTSGKVLAWNHDGTQVTGDDPVIATISPTAWASPALADFDSDGKLEIVAGFGGQPANLALLRWDGSAYGADEVILTWDHSLGYSSPVVADIDDDGELEIVTCSTDGFILGVETDGSFARGFPWVLDEYIFSSPLVDDLDGDGDMDLAVSGFDACLHVWDLASPYSSEKVPWGMFQHDRYHTGSFDFVVPADLTAPTHAIAVFQNPVLDRVMDIYVVPREQVDDQPVLVVASTIGRDTLDVTAIPGEGGIFRAHHTAEPALAETVYVTATDVYGNSGTDQRVITYSELVGNGLLVRSHDTVFEANARVEYGEPVLALLPVDSDYLLPGRDGAAARIEAAAYNLCVMGKGAHDLSLSVSAGPDPEVHLYRFEDGWQRVAGQLRDGDRIFAGGVKPGIYAIGRGRSDRSQNLFVSDAAPNPFRDGCTIMLAVSRRVQVNVSIYDVRGRLVTQVHNGPVEGTARIDWDGTDTSGRGVASGIYFIHAQAGPMAASKKVILVR